MKKKILITGSNGLLGQKLVNLFSTLDDFSVIAISMGDDRNDTAKNYTYTNIDITNTFELKQLVDRERPTHIVNCAAMTNVDLCEEKKEQCDLINVEAVKTLVAYAKTNDVHLVHISTDFIFDGEEGPYSEADKPNPVNYYGVSKLKSEKLIVDAKIKYTIIRTILVYGVVDNMRNGNIVLFVKKELEQGRKVTIVNDQFRMPTFVDDLARACLSAVIDHIYGVFHVSSNHLLSIYDMALEIAEVFHLDSSLIQPISSGELNQLARRPAKTGFDLKKSKAALDFPISSFKNRLQVFKNQLLN